MKKIKFRGKSKKENTWKVGYFIKTAGRSYIVPERQQFRDIEDPDFSNSFFEVDESTISQFTELIDKNGIDIFEGDIIKRSGVSVVLDGAGVVRWDNKRALYEVYIDDYSIHLLDDVHYAGVEVIGNIHES